MSLAFRLIAVTITANVINGPDSVLEPSVMNEVEHALSIADVSATNCIRRQVGDVFATNGLTKASIAIKMVSIQKSDGSWMVNGTNYTVEAIRILENVSGLPYKAVQ